MADRDPVKTNRSKRGWRVRYYPSGIAGMGPRTEEACATEADALERAEAIRRALALGPGMVAPANITTGELLRDWLAETGPTYSSGTLKGYRRDVNNYILPQLSAVPARSLSVRSFAAVVDGVVRKGLSLSTLDGAVRTLNAFAAWGEPRGHLEPDVFGSSRQRSPIMKRARAALGRPGEGGTITPEMCPSHTDVEAFAVGMEAAYPGRGANLVRLLASSGLRLGEALGLRVEDIDVKACTIAVRRQADRLAPWPSTKLPKGEKVRTALVWASARPVLEAAVAGADEDGWLFPPDISQFGTRGLWWVNRLTDRTTEVRRQLAWDAYGWNTHWLRHYYASYSLAPRPVGYGMQVTKVSASLGHASKTVTIDTYLADVGSHDDVLKATAKPLK